MIITQATSLSDSALQDKIIKARKMLIFHTQLGHHDRVTEIKNYVDILEAEAYNRLTNKEPTQFSKKKKKQAIAAKIKEDNGLEFGELNKGNINDKPEW